MAVITISRGSYSRGKEIAEQTADRLGYTCVSRESLLETSKDFDIPALKLIHATEDPPSFLDRHTHGRDKYVTTIRAALFTQLKHDKVVYHGFAYHALVKDLPQVLRIRVLADLEDRIRTVVRRDNISRKEAARLIKRVDVQRKKWALKLYGIDPEDPNLYDMVIRVGRASVEDAVDAICRMASRETFRTTPESMRIMADLALAAQVETLLVNVRPRVEVCIQDGFVSLRSLSPLPKESPLVDRMEEIMKRVQGVRGITVVSEKQPGERFVCLTEPGAAPAKARASAYFTEMG